MAIPTKVLYIMGHGWSGSTILGNVLGELDGFVHVGELRTLWGDGMVRGALCGCGAPLPECPFWKAVLSAGGGERGFSDLDPATVDRWHLEAARVRHTLRLLRIDPSRVRSWPALYGYSSVLSGLFPAVAETAGARVVVDSSKRTGDAALLRLVAGVEPYFVHLVRDPRGVAASWKRRRARGHGVMATTRDWMAFNLAAEVVRRRAGRGRSLLVRHEDFVREPERTLRAVAETIGEGLGGSPLVGPRTVRIGTHHTSLGNPVRFSTGEVELRPDERWRRELGPSHRALVTALSLPLLLRYGYPLR